MKTLDPTTPLKVVRKVLHKNINIGTEGTLDCFLCRTQGEESTTDFKMLSIFIGLREEVSIKLVTTAPQLSEDVEESILYILKILQDCYVKISVDERNECAKLH
jgi:hypothetical protein